MSKRILLAGESWMSYTTHVKGFDSFYTSVYETGEKFLKAAMEKAGYEFVFMPNHIAAGSFPYQMEELKEYDLLILSDIGSNTLLLPDETFRESRMMPNRCALIRDYVLSGGALLMVGGYMTFSGIDGKGRWGKTPVQEVLPVKLSDVDDRMEHCEGVRPEKIKDHPIFEGLEGQWPRVLGYNQTEAKEDAEVLATICGDPFIAVGEYGKGRSAVFTTDCAPHWAPREFCSWEGYDRLFAGLAAWLMKER